jgi:predicted nuclease of predicted toxin-antitoxin system
MNLLAYESVDRQIVERLRSEGHEVIYVAEVEQGITDDVVLSKANETGSLLLTTDKDFGELIFRRRLLNSGVVLVRLAGLLPETKEVVVATVLRERENELRQSFSVISPGRVRIRRNL